MKDDKDKIVQIDDLKLLKKHYGENFAKLCRSLFPTILESPGELYKIISAHFSPSRNLYKDITESENVETFKAYILSLFKPKSKKTASKSPLESPYDLMRKAGYILYPECKTEKDVQSFKKYYTADEEICTFWGNRTKLCRVWFAVKKNVDEIKREDFPNPKRQDEYGTSVISIQYTRSKPSTLSIKNRYNHTVKNPDATFSNNLDNIIPGLKNSFISYFGIDTKIDKHTLELPGYIKAENDKYYKYNFRIGDAYFCENNVIVNGFVAKEYDKSRFLIIDNYILDMANKTITKYKNKEFFGLHSDRDSFVDSIGQIEKINIDNLGDNNKMITIQSKGQTYPIKIMINGSNQIIGYYNHNIEKVGINFLENSVHLQTIDMPLLKECGSNFLAENKNIEMLNLPRLEKCGYNFLTRNKNLSSVCLPKLKECGSGFLSSNEKIELLDLPNLQRCGDSFLCDNRIITSVNLPKLSRVGDSFLKSNLALASLSLPKLRRVDSNFLHANQDLQYFYAPNITSCKDNFLKFNLKLTQIDLPNLKSCGKNFLHKNKIVTQVNLPNLQNADSYFLFSASDIKEISLPKLVQCKNCFMSLASNLTHFNAPNLIKCGNYFLQLSKLKSYNMNNLRTCGNFFCDGIKDNLLDINFPSLQRCGINFFSRIENVDNINLPQLRETDENFMIDCKNAKSINMPSLENCGDRFLMHCNIDGKVEFPNLKTIENYFLYYNRAMEEFSAPKLTTIGYDCLCYNRHLKKINVPSLTNFKDGLLESRLSTGEPLQINASDEIIKSLGENLSKYD